MVIVLGPKSSGMPSIWNVPAASAFTDVVVPTSETVAFGSVTPTTLIVSDSVVWSPSVPVSDAGSSPRSLTKGAVVSIVICSGAVNPLWFPVGSSAVAVNVKVPSPRAPRLTSKSTGLRAVPMPISLPSR